MSSKNCKKNKDKIFRREEFCRNVKRKFAYLPTKMYDKTIVFWNYYYVYENIKMYIMPRDVEIDYYLDMSTTM